MNSTIISSLGRTRGLHSRGDPRVAEGQKSPGIYDLMASSYGGSKDSDFVFYCHIDVGLDSLTILKRFCFLSELTSFSIKDDSDRI